MYRFRKPTDDRITAFIESQSRLDFTYASVGATRNGDAPSGFVVDHNRILIGAGPATFETAKQALSEWQHFRLDWIELHRPDVPPATDQTVGVLVRALGLWASNACKVVYVVDEENRFVDFPLPTEHCRNMLNQERFQVEWHEDDSVWYDLFAFSRPNQFLARLGYPYVRYKQKQFARESLEALKATVNAVPLKN